MFQITNAGQAVATGGVSALQINYLGGAGAIEASAVRLDLTSSNGGGTSGSTWNGYRIVGFTSASGATENGIKIDNITGGAGTENAMLVGTGWDNSLNLASGAIVLSGSAGVSNQVLTSAGAGAVPTWTSISSLPGANYWQLANHVLAPANHTDYDLAVGGNSTASAKFQVFAATGDATMSGTLTIGYGEAIRSPYGPLTLAYKSGADAWTTGLSLIDVSGNVLVANDINSSAATANLFNTGTTNLTIGGAATTFNLQGASGATVNLGNGNGATAVNIYTGSGALGLGNNAVAHTVTIGNQTGASAVTIDSGTGAINIGTAIAKTITIGNVTGTTAVNVNTGSAGTTYTTTNGIFTLNTGTGTISLGTDAVAKTINIGNSTGATAVSLNTGTGSSLNLGTNAIAHTVTIGNQTGASALTLDAGTGAINIGTAIAKTITLGNATGATSLVFNSGTNGETHNLVAGGIAKFQASAVPTTDMFQITNAGQAVATGGVSALQINYLGGAGAIEASAVRLDLTSSNGGGTSGSTWNGYRIVGFTSASGATENGIKIDNITGGAGTENAMLVGTGWDNSLNLASGAIVLSGSAGVSNQVLTSAGAGAVPTWTSISSLPGANYWQVANQCLGSCQPYGYDLAVGGNSTASAKFQVFAATGDATMSGTLTIGYGDAIRSQYGPLTLAYKSGADAWTTGLSLIDVSGNVLVANDINSSAATANLFNTGTTNLTIGGAATTFNLQGASGATVNLGNGNGATAVNIYTGSGALGLGNNAVAHTVTIGNQTGASAVTIDSGTGAINIGTAIAKTITIGNVTGTTAVNVNTGSSGTTYTTTNGIFTLNTGTGTISLGTDAVAKTINIGHSREQLQYH